jgi:hypothetical protein
LTEIKHLKYEVEKAKDPEYGQEKKEEIAEFLEGGQKRKGGVKRLERKSRVPG